MPHVYYYNFSTLFFFLLWGDRLLGWGGTKTKQKPVKKIPDACGFLAFILGTPVTQEPEQLIAFALAVTSRLTTRTSILPGATSFSLASCGLFQT
jgi:hypothetical protein